MIKRNRRQKLILIHKSISQQVILRVNTLQKTHVVNPRFGMKETNYQFLKIILFITK